MIALVIVAIVLGFFAVIFGIGAVSHHLRLIGHTPVPTRRYHRQARDSAIVSALSLGALCALVVVIHAVIGGAA